MLHIVLIILKIIGIILAVILGILVLSLCIVLFVPLRYCGEASAQDGVNSIRAKVKFSWLLHLVSGYVNYEDKDIDWQVRVLWKKLNIPDEEKITAEEEVKDEDVLIENTAKIVTEMKTDTNTETKSEKVPLTETFENTKNSNAKKRKQKKGSVLEKIKYTIKNICDKIKWMKEKKDELEKFIHNEIHRSALKRVKQELFRMFRYLKPKKLMINGYFGFEDPALTGKVLAAISILYPFFEKHIDVTPDFENVVLKGNIFVKGHFRYVHVLMMGLYLVFDKNIRITFKELKKGKAKK